jgi:predicted DNA-binding transcriptional regulator AlpA
MWLLAIREAAPDVFGTFAPRQQGVSLDRVLRWPEVAELTGWAAPRCRDWSRRSLRAPYQSDAVDNGWIASEIAERLQHRAEARNGN